MNKTITLDGQEYELVPKKVEGGRWRAQEHSYYWTVSDDFRAIICSEDDVPIDNSRYEIGNYFRTEEQAKAASKAYKTLLTYIHDDSLDNHAAQDNAMDEAINALKEDK